MRAFASSLPAVLLLAVCFGAPSGVAAQGTLTFSVTYVGDREYSGSGTAYASSLDCTADAVVTINTTATPPFDVWRGAESANCEMGSQRSLTNSPCTHIAYVTSVDNGNFELPLSTLTKVTSGTSVCTTSTAAGLGTTFMYSLIQTQTSNDTTTSTPYGEFAFRVDAQVPLAPAVATDSRTLRGESVTLSWTVNTGETDTLEYLAYVDTAGTCTNGTASSSVLAAGAAVPAGDPALEASGDDATLSAESLDVDVPSQAVVAIAVRDLAGNVSTLSPLICVSFVETMGFCDGNEDCSKNCAVRTPGAARDEGVPFALLALASLGVVVHARRRRSAK